jgi:hypothetical protein
VTEANVTPSAVVDELQQNKGSGGEGGILTWPLSLSYHLFSKMHEISMNTGDFYDLACRNYLNPFAYIAPISAPNRHQRHQGGAIENLVGSGRWFRRQASNALPREQWCC